MRIFHAVAAITVVIATQVTNTSVQMPVIAQLTAPVAYADGTSTHKIHLNINSAKPLAVISTKPSFDEAVVTPLKAKQAADALVTQQIARAKQVIASAKPAPLVIGGTDAFAQLRFCEAGGDYTKNTGNGFYGAYQYNIGTWANYGGYARPDLAPPAMQDAKAHSTQAARGWSPWPACSRKLGLL